MHVEPHMGGYRFVSPPPMVGGYDIGNVRFMLTRRPHWLARFLCRVLLDWRWRDADSQSAGDAT